MMNKGLFSSQSDMWATPQALFDELDREFGFTLDACAVACNAKCKRYFNPEQDGLQQNWGGQIVFCNPPYGKQIARWIEKAHKESRHATIVMLLPARTDTRWFHNYILGQAEIRFIRGRLHFNDSKQAAPFPSMIVIYNNK